MHPSLFRSQNLYQKASTLKDILENPFFMHLLEHIFLHIAFSKTLKIFKKSILPTS